MQVLRLGQVIEEPQNEQRVNPPIHTRHGVRGLGAHAAEQREQRGRNDAATGVGTWLLGFAHEQQQQREHERGDDAQNEHRLAAVHGVYRKSLRLDDQTAVQQVEHRKQHEHRKDFLRKYVRHIQQPRQDHVPGKGRVQPLDHDFHRAQAEHAEAPEDEGVHHAAQRIAQDLRLREADEQKILRANIGVIGADFVLGQFEPPDKPLGLLGEHPEATGEDHRENVVLQGHGAKLGRGMGAHKFAAEARRK